MRKPLPYWQDGDDWSRKSFFIKKLSLKNSLKASVLPLTSLPLCGFLFLLEGEVLAEVDGESILVRGGQFLLVPENTPFEVHHYKNITGYTGCFSLRALRDVSYSCFSARKPVLHTYWFDEATFMAEIMERVLAAFVRGDEGYVFRALDLVLYTIQNLGEVPAHPLVNRFLKMLFDRSAPPDTVSGYAARLNISASYLNKLVRVQTRHSAMDWVEIARVNWAKSLLKDRSIPVAEVALAVGIDDPSYFTRFFHKFTGMTPSAFRQQVGLRPGTL